MTGGILQLVTTGLDSIYLTDDPNITFFKMVYRRHTNFCMYPYYLNFDKELDFGQNSKCKLTAKGDIVTQLYLEIELPEIIMKLRDITKKEISDILKEYSIIWNYSGKDTDIVTVDIYNNEIVPIINKKIDTEVHIKKFMEYQLAYLNALIKNNTYVLNKMIRIKIKPGYPKCRTYGIVKINSTNKVIDNGMDLVQYIILNMAENTNYYNIINFLINTIIVYRKEEEELIRELYLYNFDDISSLIYNYFIRTLSFINNYPNLSYIYDYGDILVYNIIDQGIYAFTSDLIGINVSIYFTGVMSDSLTTNEFESNIMSMRARSKYFSYLDENNKKIYNEYEISTYKTQILNNIEWNIKKSLSMIRNILQIIRDSNVYNKTCFRIGISRIYKYISNNQYDTIDQFSSIENIPNYFYDYISDTKLPKEPINIIHFFGIAVRKGYDNMVDQILLYYRTLVDNAYYENTVIWERTDILNDNVLYLENIPTLLINDVPNYVNDRIQEFYILKKFINKFNVDNLKQVLDETVKTNIEINSSIKSYYTTAGTNIGLNKLMLSIFSPSTQYDLSSESVSSNMELISDFEIASRILYAINYSRVETIDYILYKYMLGYFDIIDGINELDDNEKLSSKQYIFNVLKVFRYMQYYTEFPSYDSYKANGYTLYGINDFTENVPQVPKYVDAICSIYYELQNNNTEKYNLFINNILNYDYLVENVGIQIAKMVSHLTDNIEHNYYTNNDNVIEKAEPVINNYVDQYIELFYKDMSNYKSNIDIYDIKNIYFEERIARYYNEKNDIAEYYYKKLISVNSEYVSLKNKIIEIIRSADNAGLKTETEFMNKFVKIIDDTDELTTQDKQILLAIINKNRNLLYNSLLIYYTQKKYGIFSSFRGSDDVLQYIIYLVATEMNINNIYDHIYIYKQTDSITIDEVDFLIYQLTDEQRNDLLDENTYNKYNNISQEILSDYNISLDTDEGILKYNTTLASFTDVEYEKYHIVQSDIAILRLVPLLTYQEYRSIVNDEQKMDQINKTMQSLNELRNDIKQNDKDSLIKSYSNLSTYYAKEIANSVNILSKISVKKKQGNKIVHVYDGSELENRLTSLINTESINFEWIKDLGHNLVDEVMFEIGGQVVETHTSEWFKIYHMINKDKNKEDGYRKMIDDNTPPGNVYTINNRMIKDKYILSIPLNFSFSKHYQAGLPLVALQYTEVNIWVKLKNLNRVATWNNNALFEKKPKLKCRILANYIYVEEEERKRICENRLEYLIEMVQRNGETIVTKNNIHNNEVTIDTFFNNSCKYLVWSVTIEKNGGEKCMNDDSSVNLMEKININGSIHTKYKKINTVKNTTIKFNGKTRESKKNGEYYNSVQPYNCGSGHIDDNIYMYTFGLDVCKYQPSGTLNTSQINNLNMVIELDENIIKGIENGDIIGRINVYNYSYNILRIMSGMAGLAFYS